MPQDKLPEPGEFTRIFKRQRLGAHGGTDPEKQPGDASGIHAAPAGESELGGARQDAPPPTITPRPPLGTVSAEQKSGEPGEFTKYFTGGLPPKAQPTGSITGTHRAHTGVQRPNTPVQSPRNLASDSSGSFTEKFAPRQDASLLRTEQYGVHNPQMGPAPDLSKRSLPDQRGDFDFGKPPSQKNQPGEYTSLFGHGDVPPPPRQAAVSAAPAAPMMSDSPNSFAGRPARDAAPAPDLPKGPSEFTEIARGRQAPASLANTAAEPPSVANSSAGTKKMPLNINLNPVNPMAVLPHAGNAGLQVPPVPQLNVGAAGAGVSKLSDQTKLILFFGVLAILAVILVVVVVAKN